MASGGVLSVTHYQKWLQDSGQLVHDTLRAWLYLPVQRYCINKLRFLSHHSCYISAIYILITVLWRIDCSPDNDHCFVSAARQHLPSPQLLDDPFSSRQTAHTSYKTPIKFSNLFKPRNLHFRAVWRAKDSMRLGSQLLSRRVPVVVFSGKDVLWKITM